MSPIPWPLALTVAFGAFMSQLDTSVVAVGLDTIARDLDAPLDHAQWVANGYLLALGLSLPAAGWLARRHGAGRVWLVALAAFTVTSASCALAPTVEWLIALRVLQGLSAGLLIPAGQTVLGQAVGPDRLGQVMATLGIAVSVAPALGPVAGAALIEVAAWPWLFAVNVPLGALALLLGRRHVPPGTSARSGPMDWRGLALVSAAVPLLVYGSEARDAALMVAGALALAAFTAAARRSRHPILDLELFANRAFAAASVTGAFAGAAMFGAALLFPLYLQLGHDASVLETGVALIPLAAGTALALPVTGRLVDRHGGGIIAAIGAAGTVATTLPYALGDPGEAPLLLFARGIAIAFAVVPTGTAAYTAVSAEQLPDATTLFNILLRIGGALGGALLTAVLVEQSVRAAFGWLTGASALGLVSALVLAGVTRRRGPPETSSAPRRRRLSRG